MTNPPTTPTAQKVLERLSQVTLPQDLQPQMGTDWSPVGQIYLVHADEHQSAIRPDGAEVARGLVLEKQFKSVPNVVDVSSFGGIDPRVSGSRRSGETDAYGLTVGQVEQQLTNNNVNAGGSFIEAGLATDQRARGRTGHQRGRHRADRDQDPERYAASRQRHRHRDAGRRNQSGQIGKAIHRTTVTFSTTTMWSKASCCCGKAPKPIRRSWRIHEKVKELNDHILPPGVKIVPFLDRSDLVHYTTHTVLHNLTEGIILVVDHSLSLSRQRARRDHRRADHSVFAAVRVDLPGPAPHPREPAVARRTRLRHGGGRRGRDGREHRAASGPARMRTKPPLRADSRGRARSAAAGFYAIAIIITAYLPIFTLQRVEGRLFKPMAWTVAFALLGALIFSMLLAPVLASLLFPRRRAGMAQPGDGLPDATATGGVRLGDSASLGHGGPRGRFGWLVGVSRRRAACIGSEFLPHLDEGAIWVRGTLAPSTGPTEGIAPDESGAASSWLRSRK